MDKLYFLYLEKLSQQGLPDWVLAIFWYLLQFCIIAFMLVVIVIFLVLAERKVLAFFTLRKGPNRVGWNGCLQTIADAIKLLFKENITPKGCDKFLFTLAPIVAFVPIMVVWGLIPFNSDFNAINSSIGAFLYMAIVAMPLLGILLAGYASNNKYSLLGAMRAVIQSISFELPMLTVILSIVILAGTMSLRDIINSQSSILGIGGWFVIPGLLGFCIFYVCSLAELNRTPFDFSEAESELVSGYNTEYSGMRFALFFLAEYASLFVLCALMVTLFFGGYLSPFGFYICEKIFESSSSNQILNIAIYFEQIIWFLGKVFCLILSIMWIRATFPRFRADKLLDISWKYLLPLSVLNLLIVCFIKLWGGR